MKNLDCYELINQPENYAAVLFSTERIKDNVIEELNKVFGEEKYYVLDIGFDDYDSSIEICFSDRTPRDLQGNEKVQELITTWGFGRAYLNFTDNTQQLIYCKNSNLKEGCSGVGRRYDWGWENTRWNKEKADKLE